MTGQTEPRRRGLPPRQRGWTTITFSATPEERKHIKADAAGLGMNVSEYLRTLWLLDRQQRGLVKLR